MLLSGVALLAMFVAPPAPPTLRLPTVLSSNMVLQRAHKPGVRAVLWGWSNHSDHVSVSIDGTVVGTAIPNASAAGRWSLALPVAVHREASTGHTIVIGAGTAGATETLTNVAFGDVYLCSGQSNMEYSVNKAFNASAEIADSIHYPDLRFVTFSSHSAEASLRAQVEPWAYPKSKAKYTWGISEPKNFEPVNGAIQSYPCAVCYFFGRDLYRQLGGKVPIGLVAATQGGTKIELFMSPDAIADTSCGRTVQPGVQPRVGPSSTLWFGMLEPLVPLKLSGWVWYQGEANDLGKIGPFVGPESYRCHFPSMIASWRSAWGQAELPFYYVLLAAGHTAILREAQVAGASLLSNTAWASAADLGDGVAGGPDGPAPIPGHPRRKQEVGRRLSLAALNLSYGEAVRWKGPTIASATARRVSLTKRSTAEKDITAAVQVEVILLMNNAAGLHMHGTADCVACCTGIASSPIMIAAVPTGVPALGSLASRGDTTNCDLLHRVCPGQEGRNASCLVCTRAHAQELNRTKGCSDQLISDWCLKRKTRSDCSEVLKTECPDEEGKNVSCIACVTKNSKALHAAGCTEALLKDWCVAAPSSTMTGVRAMVNIVGTTITAKASLPSTQLPANASHLTVLLQFENFPQCAFYSGIADDGPEPRGVYKGTGLVADQARITVALGD